MKNFDDFLKTVDMNKLVSPTVDAIENSDNPISAISALSTSIAINLLPACSKLFPNLKNTVGTVCLFLTAESCKSVLPCLRKSGSQ